MITLKRLPSAERALLELIKTLPDENIPDDQIGGDFAFRKSAHPFYIRIDRVPGGRAGQIQGDQVVDIEVFSGNYLTADSLAFALDALLLGYPHAVEVDGRKVVLDRVYQNVAPADLPWEDDSVFRIGATYSITVRRG